MSRAQPIERFEAHLADPAPGFRCYACGDRIAKTTILARVNNQIGRPASKRALATVLALLGESSPVLKRFVELHDGIVLYRDTKSDASGVEFFKAKEWESRTAEMQESMQAMGFDESDMPDWFRVGVVFGEIPQSGNYFVIQPKGVESGQVFYADHDDFRTDAFAGSFEQFLELIVGDPPGFLYRCGCFLRCSDGKTETQWIPKEYVPDTKSR
jgi:hypothetical protein